MARVEDRLASLEADLSHNTATSEAMSSIIDQVPTLTLLYTTPLKEFALHSGAVDRVHHACLASQHQLLPSMRSLVSL